MKRFKFKRLHKHSNIHLTRNNVDLVKMDFKHSSAIGEESIRLRQFVPRKAFPDLSEKPELLIETYPIDNAPAYTALSYT
jgi:hypothetical protein